MLVIRCTLESLRFHHVKGLTVTETDASSKCDDKLLFRESLFFGLLPSTDMNYVVTQRYFKTVPSFYPPLNKKNICVFLIVHIGYFNYVLFCETAILNIYGVIVQCRS